VAHQLTQGETDRFAVVITAREMGMGVFRWWRLQPTLVTSEGDIVSPPIEVGLPRNYKSHSRRGHE
jgi:hypothetical protein